MGLVDGAIDEGEHEAAAYRNGKGLEEVANVRHLLRSLLISFDVTILLDDPEDSRRFDGRKVQSGIRGSDPRESSLEQISRRRTSVVKETSVTARSTAAFQSLLSRPFSQSHCVIRVTHRRWQKCVPTQNRNPTTNDQLMPGETAAKRDDDT